MRVFEVLSFIRFHHNHTETLYKPFRILKYTLQCVQAGTEVPRETQLAKLAKNYLTLPILGEIQINYIEINPNH